MILFIEAIPLSLLQALGEYDLCSFSERKQSDLVLCA